jgi:predicted dehydrogenase
MATQLDHFFDVLERKATPLVTVEDALQSLRVVEAVRQSVELGAEVTL